MYIQPNSEIRILKEIPFDNSYKDTLYFSTLQEQTTYFTSKTKYTLSAQYYVRVNRGVIKVEQPIQNIQDCNYLMFRNISFGNKWFYAFILNVEYVNNETSKIEFEIDVMQTYFFNIFLKSCFIEREHSATDAIADNIEDEPFNIEDYVYQSFGNIYAGDLDTLKIVVAYARNYGVGERIEPYSIIDNTIQCVDLFAFDINSTGALHLGQAIDRVVSLNQIDNIIDIYAVPSIMLPDNSVTNTTDFTYRANAIPTRSLGKHVQTVVAKPQSGMIFTDVKGGNEANYIPKNNKLYTYPYCCLEISTPNGQKVQYAFEDFPNANNAEFDIVGTITNPVQISIFPRYYKRLGGVESLPPNSEAGLTIASYPKTAYSSDAYKAWLAQNSVPMIINTIMAGIGGAIVGGAMSGGAGAGVGAELAITGETSAITGAGIGALFGMGKSMANDTASAIKAMRTSDATRGSINNGNVLHSQGIYTFNKAVKHIPNQIMRNVDNFFTMYGYASNNVKVPNRAVRERFTYTKTKGCTALGDAPADDVRKICSIYDNGIRFWRDTTSVGDFTSLNRPLSEV